MEIIEIIIHIILGLIIGMIIGYKLFKENIYKGPDSNIISQEIYTEKDGTKYKWVPSICICPINYSMDKLKVQTYSHPNH